MKQSYYSVKYFLTLVFSFFALCPAVFSQQAEADSLKNIIRRLDGPKKVDALNELADVCQYIDTKQAIEYANEGLQLAYSINYQKGVASNLSTLGFCYVNLDNKKAIDYTKKALAIRKKINNKAGIATSLNLMGVISYYAGDYLPAIDYHHQALKLREEIGNKVKIATSYNNIALVHIAIGNYETALDFLFKALNVRIETGNKKGIGIIKDNIGDVYRKMNRYDMAIKYFHEALTVNKAIGNKKSEANSYFNIASAYRMLSDYKKAFEYYKLSNQIYMDLDEKKGIANVENGIALTSQKTGQGDSAIKHALIAYKYAGQINSKDNISLASKTLQECYGNAGDYKNAFKFSLIYQNSLQNIEKIQQLTKTEYKNKLEKIKKEQEAEISGQRTFIEFLVVTLSLTIIIILMVIYGYRNKKQTNVQLNKYNSDLRDVNSKLEEANTTKDRFFSIIAHDLRGPFQSLLGASGVLASDVENLNVDEIKELGNALNASLNKQYGLINDLLEWSRLQNGNFNLNYEKLELRNIVDEASEALAFSITRKEIRLFNNVAPEYWLYADRHMLQLVLRNLISNSVKFTHSGGEISVAAVEKEKFIEVTVADNGVGISDKDIDKLFRIDVQHTTKGTSDETGTGLGLTLCKEIIEKHNGKIQVDSRQGKGCSFIIFIPKDGSRHIG